MTDADFNGFIAEMMRYASTETSPDLVINNLLEYICLMLQAHRAYIFEESENGNFSNTYEYCNMDIVSQMQNRQTLSDVLLTEWKETFSKYQNVVIRDISIYKGTEAFDILSSQSVTSLVAGPIEINNKIVGFFGMDNPPLEILDEISELINVIGFIFDMMIRMRNFSRALDESTKTDPLTGYHNRKALEWAYNGDFSDASSISIIMCDLNGLKAKNDIEGHEAGDRYICDAAALLGEYFGKSNVYRLGGDEFLVVKLSETQENISTTITKVENEGELRNVSISMGFEYRESFTEDFENMLHAADEKMYLAKEAYYARTGKERRKV